MADSALAVQQFGVEQHLRLRWDAVACPVAYDGVAFTPPNGPWLRLTVLWGSADLATHTDSGYNELVGIIVGDIFAVPGQGYATALQYADDFRTIFDRATIGAVECRAASGPQTITDPDGWLHVQVSVPFTVDDLS